MQIFLHRNWEKQYDKLNAEIQEKVDERLQIFLQNPHHQLLHNHKLKGEWQGYRSINITGDYRALYREVEDGVAEFYTVDTHSNLYD